MEVRRSLVPSPATIIANREKNLSWEIVLGELIDNAFDAGATEVRLEFFPRKLRVSDNGRGASDTGAMLASGVRTQHPGVTLGRYGVGLSDAAQWLGGVTTIATCDGTLLRTATADWDRIARQAQWPELLEQTFPPETAVSSNLLWSATGTMIEFRHTRSYPPFDKLRAKLGFTYFPGLTAERRNIVFVHSGKRTPVQPSLGPRLADNTRHAVSFDVNGKSVHADGGMVREGELNPYPGFHFAYKYRIVQSSEVPCDGYVTSRFFALVSLGHEWPLARNKDLITTNADDQDSLFVRLRLEYAHLMEACSSNALALEVNALAGDLSRRLTDLLEMQHEVAERREPGEDKGAHPKKGTSRKTTVAFKTKAGGRILRAPRVTKIHIDFVDGDDDKLGSWSCSFGILRIKLTNQFPAVAKARANGAAGHDRLLFYAMMLAVPALAESPQRHLPGLMDANNTERIIAVASDLVHKHDCVMPLRKKA